MAAVECTLGNYALGPLIGSGGTSEVYAGEHRFLGEPVAIKLLRSDVGNDALLHGARRTRYGRGADTVVHPGGPPSPGEPVAIKLLPSAVGNDAFLAEARRTRAIQ